MKQALGLFLVTAALLMVSTQDLPIGSELKAPQAVSRANALSHPAWTAATGFDTRPGSASEIEFAYIGPGAGFAFLGSFLTLLGGLFLGAVSLLTWPFRMLWRLATAGKSYKQAKIKKLIFLGLDGLDPGLTERFMAAGKLPNFARLM